MCSINGFTFSNKNLLEKMNQATKHRGPDGTGVYFDESISLGHNRLSILDISHSADQPMQSSDGNLVIVFNGEIYNFKELKKELLDYSFKTKGDTEVILAAYQKWGKDCLNKFDGIFAFAIWDKTKKELFMARDQMGVKPFYYFFDREKFIFSSEIKGILEHPISRKLNLESFNHYMRVLYVPEPLTMIEEIYKLPKASYAIFKDGQFDIKEYCQSRESKIITSFEEAKGEVFDTVNESVQAQLISDRPLGVYLSGGIDSSVVLDSVSRVRKNIDTFSVGFDLREGEQVEKFNSDFELARRTARHYNTKHHEVLLSVDDVVNNFEKVTWHMDEPISNPTAFAMFKLSQFTKSEGIDVVLGGDGGDELFGGYERYRMSLYASAYHFLPRILRNSLVFNDKFKKLNIPSGIERFKLFMFQKEKIIEDVVSTTYNNIDITTKFFSKKYFYKKTPSDFESELMNVDRQTWLVDFYLMLADTMSMSHGIEQRVPLLDKSLVELSANISRPHKISLFNTKIVLKEAFRGHIPDYLLNQPKRGFFSPGAKWLRYEKMYKLVNDTLNKDYYPELSELFIWQNITKVTENHYNKKEYNLNIIWAILTFQVWAKIFKITLK